MSQRAEIAALGDGTALHTLAGARDMILRSVPELKQRRPAWQSAAGKLMAAVESGALADIEAATTQVELALLLDGRLRLRWRAR
jgi:hypothetical protein